MKKYSLYSALLAFTLLLCFQGYAQNQLTDNIYGVYYVPSLYTKLYESDEGSPYLNPRFTPAKINDSNKTYLVRINAHKETAEVWVSEDRVIELSNERKNSIALSDGSDKNYEAARYVKPKGNYGNAFFQSVEKNDKYSLFLKERIKYFKKEKAEGYKAEKPARFEKIKPYYYLRVGADEKKALVHLPSSTNKFVQVFAKSRHKALKGYIKQEKLNLASEDDLIKVLDYIYKS